MSSLHLLQPLAVCGKGLAGLLLSLGELTTYLGKWVPIISAPNISAMTSKAVCLNSRLAKPYLNIAPDPLPMCLCP